MTSPSRFSARSGVERIGVPVFVGLLLLPLVIGGLMIWALWSPTADLDRVTAAIVNDDEPVTVNGKTVPLGRQFAAGLMAGSMDTNADSTSANPNTNPNTKTSNFDWILTNDDDARAGLLDGRYVAAITIPKSFSADGTSLSGPAAQARQASLRIQTSPVSSLVDPALSAAVTSAATAALNVQLTSQYLSNIYAGFNSINQQIGQAAEGAASLSTGATSVSNGAQSLNSGAASLAAGIASLDQGAGALANGLGTLSDQSQSLPAATTQLAQGAGGVAAAVDGLSGAVADSASRFAQVVAQICRVPGPGPVCDSAQSALAKLDSASASASQLSAGADEVASGNQQLAAAMPPLVAGIDESAAGAGQVAAGATQADSGASQVSSGAASLASGAAQVDTGAAQLSDGLDQAVTKIPTYTDADITTLSSVGAQPVLADQSAATPGLQSVPVFAVVALWFGGFAIALARQAVPTRRLLTAASSGAIALRSAGAALLLGAGQGLLFASVVEIPLGLGTVQWLALAGLAIVVGGVFALLNQGLAAVLGSGGRLIAIIAGIVALVAGLSSTIPPVLAATAAALPTSPGLAVLRAGVAGDSGATLSGLVALIVFGVAGLALVFIGVASRRGIRALDPSRRRALMDA
jgi:putative membrane protein